MTLIHWLVIAVVVYAVSGSVMFIYLAGDKYWSTFPAFVGACIWPVILYKGISNYVVENMPAFRKELKDTMPAFRKELKDTFGKEERK